MLLFNSDNLTERVKELLQEERDLKRQQALQNSKHPRLRRLVYGVSDFGSGFFDNPDTNTRTKYQRENQALGALTNLRRAGIQDSDLYTTDPNKRETIRDILSKY